MCCSLAQQAPACHRRAGAWLPLCCCLPFQCKCIFPSSCALHTRFADVMLLPPGSADLPPCAKGTKFRLLCTFDPNTGVAIRQGLTYGLSPLEAKIALAPSIPDAGFLSTFEKDRIANLLLMHESTSPWRFSLSSFPHLSANADSPFFNSKLTKASWGDDEVRGWPDSDPLKILCGLIEAEVKTSHQKNVILTRAGRRLNMEQALRACAGCGVRRSVPAHPPLSSPLHFGSLSLGPPFSNSSPSPPPPLPARRLAPTALAESPPLLCLFWCTSPVARIGLWTFAPLPSPSRVPLLIRLTLLLRAESSRTLPCTPSLTRGWSCSC